MKKINEWGIIALFLLLVSCGDHHAHEHGVSDKHEHEHEHEDEIAFHDEKALEIGLEIETVMPKSFTMAIKATGEIASAQGEEKIMAATMAGIVSYNKGIVVGKEIGRNMTVATIAADRLQDGDPIAKAKIDYEIAAQEYDRACKLLNDKIISQKDFNEIKLNYETAGIVYKALADKHSEKGCEIVAPSHGFVKELLVKEGEYVAVGTPLLLISENNKLMLTADVSEKYFSELPFITSARFKTSYNEELYDLAQLNGRMLSYGRSAMPGSYYIPVLFEMDNVAGLYPGAFAEIYLQTRSLENVIAVPRSALVEEQGIYSVFVKVHEEAYKKQPVTLGKDNGTEVQICAGLNAGDKVVVKGAYYLKLASATAAIPAHSHEH